MPSLDFNDQRVAHFGRFQFDVASRRLLRDQLPLEMQDAATRALAILILNAGRTVAYADLTRAVSPSASDIAEHSASAPEVLRATIRQLRQAFRDPADHPMYIETMRGVGYRFIAPVRMAPDTMVAMEAAVDPAGHQVDVSPPAHLAEWVAADAAAIDFTVLWSCVALPSAVLLIGWRYAPLMMVPVALRLGFRFFALRDMKSGGSSARELHDALCWADASVGESNDPIGWRRWLRRGRNMLLLGAMACVLALQVAIGFELPWTGSATSQNWWARYFYACFGLVALAVLALIADAVLTPRPVLHGVRLWLQRAWRRVLKRRLASGAPDPYETLPREESDSLPVSTAISGHSAGR